MPIHTDIAYIADDNPRHTLDIYVPDKASENLPLAIFIHGGSWRTGDKSECTVLAHGLVSQSLGKLAVAVINYGLSQRTPDSIRHPAHLHDAIKAVQFLVNGDKDYPDKYLIDRSNIYLIGHSAGAHLASLMVLSNQLDCIASIRGVLGVGGIYDIPGLLELYPDYADFIDMAFDPAQYQEASPQHIAKCRYADAEHIRFLIVNSAGDSLIAATHAVGFASQLIRTGYTNVELVVRDLGSHFGMLDNEEFWRVAINFVQ
ncbi:hypothetical protein GGH94_000019 [Coemansia aciculifera]|uniref:BD-FAE-like domain-containing protein n=1 Tax=Coemansia aciculifera TaxID=417176 RepID=A0A9W8IN96_9FUNG|nr:hypothetical protein GGH94_000019 [Coemansia aciculifera]KAJ2872869.1 hypothetical protein GGH93_003683 [Coemansia aciculifera]KAJ2881415.1 hypothetical protein H4R27_004099 [Coemansia aciculifera]